MICFAVLIVPYDLITGQRNIIKNLACFDRTSKNFKITSTRTVALKRYDTNVAGSCWVRKFIFYVSGTIVIPLEHFDFLVCFHRYEFLAIQTTSKRIFCYTDVRIRIKYFHFTQCQDLIIFTNVTTSKGTIVLFAFQSNINVTTLNAFITTTINVSPLITVKISVFKYSARSSSNCILNITLIGNKDFKIRQPLFAIITTMIITAQYSNKTNRCWINQINSKPWITILMIRRTTVTCIKIGTYTTIKCFGRCRMLCIPFIIHGCTNFTFGKIVTSRCTPSRKYTTNGILVTKIQFKVINTVCHGGITIGTTHCPYICGTCAITWIHWISNIGTHVRTRWTPYSLTQTYRLSTKTHIDLCSHWCYNKSNSVLVHMVSTICNINFHFVGCKIFTIDLKFNFTSFWNIDSCFGCCRFPWIIQRTGRVACRSLWTCFCALICVWRTTTRWFRALSSWWINKGKYCNTLFCMECDGTNTRLHGKFRTEQKWIRANQLLRKFLNH